MKVMQTTKTYTVIHKNPGFGWPENCCGDIMGKGFQVTITEEKGTWVKVRGDKLFSAGWIPKYQLEEL